LASDGKDLVSRGVLLLTVMTEGRTGADVATKANLIAWIGRVPTYHSATLDAALDGMPSPLEEFFGVPRDTFFLVDLRTMKVVDVWRADPGAAIQAATDLLDAEGM
jgi:hypothetical protein